MMMIYHFKLLKTISMSHSDIFIQEQEEVYNHWEEMEREVTDQRQHENEQPTPSEWDEIEKQSLTALNQFQKGLTKVDIKEMAYNAVENVLISGNPLQVAEALSGMDMFIKEVRENPQYKKYVREEAGKYPKGLTAKSGAKIECVEAGTVYDFSKCGDTELNGLEEILLSLKEDIKRRQEFLKKIPATGIDTVDRETGEVIKIYPPSKSSTSSIKVTLSKGF